MFTVPFYEENCYSIPRLQCNDKAKEQLWWYLDSKDALLYPYCFVSSVTINYKCVCCLRTWIWRLEESHLYTYIMAIFTFSWTLALLFLLWNYDGSSDRMVLCEVILGCIVKLWAFLFAGNHLKPILDFVNPQHE